MQNNTTETKGTPLLLSQWKKFAVALLGVIPLVLIFGLWENASFIMKMAFVFLSVFGTFIIAEIILHKTSVQQHVFGYILHGLSGFYLFTFFLIFAITSSDALEAESLNDMILGLLVSWILAVLLAISYAGIYQHYRSQIFIFLSWLFATGGYSAFSIWFLQSSAPVPLGSTVPSSIEWDSNPFWVVHYELSFILPIMYFLVMGGVIYLLRDKKVFSRIISGIVIVMITGFIFLEFGSRI